MHGKKRQAVGTEQSALAVATPEGQTATVTWSFAEAGSEAVRAAQEKTTKR